MDTFVNKVADSGLITLDLENYYPKGEVIVFDLKDYLYREMILKEKEFRESLKSLDLEKFRGKNVAVICSVEAIIPVWAFMLIASYLQPVAKELVLGNEQELLRTVFLKNIANLNIEEFRDQRIVVKGCGDVPIGEFAYMEVTKVLQPIVKSIMYGEPCSTVPIYKRPAKAKD